MSDFRFELPDRLKEIVRQAARFQIPPKMLETIRQANKAQLPPGYLEMVRNAQRTFEKTVEALAPAQESRRILETLEQVAKIFRESWAYAMPPNWAELEPAEVLGVIDVVRDTGFALVWLPRVEIVRNILTDPSKTAEILLAEKDDVLADASSCLGPVDTDELQGIREAIEKSIAALRDGHDSPAQALASVAFTTECHMLHGKRLSDAYKEMADEDPSNAGITQLRIRTIYLAGKRALEQFDLSVDPNGASHFNRHNSAHRITAAQWSERNALSALVLATALLREMQFWLARQRASEHGT